jgi:G3E family GTPase
MIPNSKKIPTVVLCGFLGSGKTTILNGLLKGFNGSKIGVIVNDFGSINVDSLLVAKQSDDKIELSNGCICCEVGEGGLESAITQISYKNSPIEAIVIEASGLAEPGGLMLALLATNNKYAKVDSLVYVVDAANFNETKNKHPELVDHLKIADLIILNKVDLVDEAKLKALEGELADQADGAFCLRAENGQLDYRLILDLESGETSGPRQLGLILDSAENGSDGHHDHKDHLHSSYASFNFEDDRAMNPQRLFELLDGTKLKGVYRLKGWIYFGMKGLGQFFILQKVGRSWKLYIDKSGKNFSPKTNLTIIGDGFNQKDVLSLIESCIDEAPDEVDASSMLDVLDYEEA